MANDVSVAFVRTGNFTMTGALTGGCAPAPVGWQTVPIPGPRTEAQVLEEIDACEKALWRLRSELKGLQSGKNDE